MLESLGSDVWIADGSMVLFHGFDYPTRMVIVRLADGGLWLWSPIKKSAEIEGSVRALGQVRHIVSPNKLHYLFLVNGRRRFRTPNCGALHRRSPNVSYLKFSETLTNDLPLDWAGQIDQAYFTNSAFMDELIFFHRSSRTVIIADLSQTFSQGFLKLHWPWWMQVIARLSKMTDGWGYPPIDYRISFRHRASALPKIRASIDKHPEHVGCARRSCSEGRRGISATRLFMAVLMELASATG